MIVSFEYQIFEFGVSPVDELNDLGSRAWELVLLADAPHLPLGRRRGIFKRKVVTLPNVPLPGTKRVAI